ncbi:MAG TPA: RNA polymerase sigma factor [Bryobacteraceae bacterium]|jgi:RNA polymerase sigma-70 factor (ECF subfamily)|nr:RNA polymerase sigma factor [Bryobacteraceae bacterium]
MDCSPENPPAATEIQQEIALLYAREAAGVLRYACALARDRETAHDALQEAFFRYFLCRSAGQGVRSPKAWLFRVAHNYVLDQMNAVRRNSVGIEHLDNLPGPAHEWRTGVSGLLDGLPEIGLSERELECVLLRAEDFRYEEIAGMLGIQAGTVGALLTRAHAKIRKAVNDRELQRHRFSPELMAEKGYAS